MVERSSDAHLNMHLEVLHQKTPSEYRLSRTDFMLRTVLPYLTNILFHFYVTAAPIFCSITIAEKI